MDNFRIHEHTNRTSPYKQTCRYTLHNNIFSKNYSKSAPNCGNTNVMKVTAVFQLIQRQIQKPKHSDPYHQLYNKINASLFFLNAHSTNQLCIWAQQGANENTIRSAQQWKTKQIINRRSAVASRSSDHDTILLEVVGWNMKIQRCRTFPYASGSVIMRAMARTVVTKVIASTNYSLFNITSICNYYSWTK